MPKTHATPKKTLEEVEKELQNAKHARKKYDLTLELCRYMRKDLPRMLTLAQSAYEITIQNPSLGLFRKAKALWWVAYSYSRLQQHDISISTFEQVIILYANLTPDDTKNFTQEEVGIFATELYDNIAIGNFYTGNLETAMEYFTKTLQIAEQFELTGAVVSANNSLGEIWRNAGNIEKAYIHWNTALNYSFHVNDLRRVAELYSNIASAHEFYGEFDEAIELINKAINHARAYDNDYGICVVLLNRSRLYLYKKQWERIKPDIEECLAIAKVYNYLMIEIQAVMILAKLNVEQGFIKQAITYFQQAYNSANERNEKTSCGQAALGLADCYKKKGTLTKAIYWAKQTLDIAILLNSISLKASSIRLLADIKMLQGDAILSNMYLQEYIDIMEELNKEQHTSEVREARLRLSFESTELERRELAKRTAELERNLQEKRAELSSLAISISQKNSVIEKLSKRLEELSNATDASYSERCKTMVHEIESLKHSGEEQWNNLQKQFESIDTGFQSRLTQRFVTLSQYEIKICLLMRLNLSSKDIANILWTSARTVETQRYSIRKKLQLGKDDNLYSVLINL